MIYIKLDILFYTISYNYDSNDKSWIEKQVSNVLRWEKNIILNEINNFGIKGVSVMHGLIFNSISKDNNYLIMIDVEYISWEYA